jgi:hypothetical protein
MTSDRLLDERESTHGSFADNARFAQGLKAALRAHDGWERMPPVQREALDNIALKLARALSNGRCEDHWLDIEGYAALARRAIEPSTKGD